MKLKLTALSLAAFILFSGFTYTFSRSDQEAKITLASNGAEVEEGQWFEVQFYCQDVDDLPNLWYQLHYDPALFEHDKPTSKEERLLDSDDRWDYQDKETGLRFTFEDEGNGQTPLCWPNSERVATVRLRTRENTPKGSYTFRLSGGYEQLPRDSANWLRFDSYDRITKEMAESTLTIVIQ